MQQLTKIGRGKILIMRRIKLYDKRDISSALCKLHFQEMCPLSDDSKNDSSLNILKSKEMVTIFFVLILESKR